MTTKTPAVEEYPMIFSALMVRALRTDLKTQTRRIISKRNSVVGAWKWEDLDWSGEPIYEDSGYLHVSSKPPGQENDCVVDRVYSRIEVGDRIRVKETWAAVWPGVFPAPLEECYIEYRADTNGAKYPGHWDDAEPEDAKADAPRWRAAGSMPHWASRETLEVTGVRCERDANDWLWVYEFRRLA